MRGRLLSVSLTVLLWGCLGAGRADAIPIIHGQGETITFLADLPDNAPVRDQVRNGRDKPTKLGYRYWRFHLFWADVWTSDGEFVVYQEEHFGQHHKLGNNARDAAHQAGLKPREVRVPLLYRFPLGWWIIGGFILLKIYRGKSDKDSKTPEETAPTPMPVELQLLSDERYQKALEAMKLEGQPLEQLSMSDIQRGIDVLVEQGIPREEAEQKLALVLEYLRNLQQGQAT